MNPMECRKLLKHLSDYLDQDLSPALCRHIESHMKGCKPCITFISTLRKTRAILKRQPKASPPPRLRSALRRRLAKLLAKA